MKGGTDGYNWDYRDYAEKNPEQYTDASINSENVKSYSDALPTSDYGLTPEQIKDRNWDETKTSVTKVGVALLAGGAVVSIPALAAAASVSFDACVANIYACGNSAGLVVTEVLAGDAVGGVALTAGAGVGAKKLADELIDVIDDTARLASKAGKVDDVVLGRLPDFDLSKVDPPKGKSYDGTVHRYEKPEYVETTWEQHQGNIDASHRYTGEGQGGVYAGTSQQTALDEIKYYDINAEDQRIPVNQDIKLNNVLDLTDQNVRERIGVDLDDITNSTDYTKTQQIGNWAKKNGYDGILAPSARNPEGSNIVILKND